MFNLLRKAGQKVRAFDDAYAEKVQELIAAHMPTKAVSPMTMATGVPLSKRVQLDEGDSESMRNLMQVGITGSNALTRYGVPLLGAKLIADGVDALYDAASDIPLGPQQSEGTLAM